jgi:hypothetical protein
MADGSDADRVNLEQMLDLATAAGCDRDALHAVLGHLVAKGVFTQAAPGRFAANRAAEQLSDPHRFLDLDGIGGRMAHTWGTLLDYVRTGPPAGRPRDRRRAHAGLRPLRGRVPAGAARAGDQEGSRVTREDAEAARLSSGRNVLG